MPYVVGIVLSLGAAFLARHVGFDRDRAFYPTVLIVIASYYALFAVMGGSVHALFYDSIVMMGFVAAAVIGFKSSPWIVVLALVGHGILDAFHARIVDNPGVPPWWPPFCLAFDVGAAGCLAWFTKAPTGHLSRMTNGELLRAFMDRVWTAGEVAAVDEYLAASYTIYSDPGDPWDGQTLDRDTFKQRLISSRGPFPDLRFDLEEFVEGENRVALGWTMRGTNTGSVGDRAPSGQPIVVHGLTIYYFTNGRIIGHRQVVDRLSVVQQLGLID